MKTNLTNLMNLVSELERSFNNEAYSIRNYAYSTTIQELNGVENVIEDYKEDFDNAFNEFKRNQELLRKYKAIIYEKNNSYKLPDGRSIQVAISDNTNLRKMKSVYEQLISKRSTKRRETEVNNSYFECKTINYDVKAMKAEYDEIERKIQDTDFEISKLNSIEFDIDI